MSELIIYIPVAVLIIALAGYGAWMATKRLLQRFRERQRSKRAIERFTIDDREAFGLYEVYKDKFGNRWYGFTNAARMPAVRSIYCEVATRQAEMNLTKEALESYIVKIENFMNQGEFVSCAHLFAELKARLTDACEEATLLALAGYYFVIEGEDPGTVVDSQIQRKRKIWEEDEACKAFFLLTSYRTTNKLSNISESDILAYLVEASIKRQTQPK